MPKPPDSSRALPSRPTPPPPTPEVCPPAPLTPPAAPLPLSAWASGALDFHPDPLQARILDCPASRVIVVTARQTGKSTLAALRALHTALHHPRSLSLLVCPVSNQAGEILAKVRAFAARLLGHALPSDGHNRLSLRLPNGSRIVARPGVPDSLRSYSAVRLLVIDEAALLPDEAYSVVTPVLAASGGDLWLLSTPKGQTGRFADIWHAADPAWARFSLPADACPRFSREFLDAERLLHGDRSFAQEYLCQFLGAASQLLSRQQIEAVSTAAPHEPAAGLREKNELYLGLDPGKRQDHTALVVAKLTWANGERNPVDFSIPCHPRLTVRAAYRLPLDTDLISVPRFVRDQFQRHAPSYLDPRQREHLVVDATGGGHALVELLRAERLPARLRPVVLSGGEFSNPLKDGYVSVPRTALYETLQLLFERRAISLDRSGPGFPLLERELARCAFDGTQREHDDLVMALALAAWQAVQDHPKLLGLPPSPELFPPRRIL